MLKRVFPVLALALFSSNLGMGVVTPLLPLYAKTLGAEGVWTGAIIAAYGATSILSTPIFGRLSDRKGRKLFICVGLLGYSLISLGYIWSSSIFSLILVRLLQGAAGGMVLPIATAYMGDLSPKGEEGKWLGYANAAFFSGFGIGPLLGGVLTDHFGMVVTFSTMGGLNLIALLVAVLFLPKTESRREVKGVAPRPSLREMTRSSMVRGLFFFQFAQALGRSGFMTFLPLFAVAQADLSPTLIGLVLSTNMILISLIGPVCGAIADRLNRRWLVVGGSLLVILPLALMPAADNFWHLMIVSAILALGAAVAMTAGSALSVDEGRKFGMGSTLGAITTGMNAGFATGPVLSGIIVDLGEISSAFYFGSFVTFIGTGLFTWLTRR